MEKINRTNASLASQYIHIFVAISTYWICAIGMVFLNKYLLSSADVKLDAVVFITWYQCLITVILGLLSSSTYSLLCGDKSSQTSNQKLFFRNHLLKVLPLSFIFVVMITTNNLCLKYIGVSFYYVGRSLTTVFNVICSYIILGELTSRASTICCIVIVCGFILGVDQEDVAGSLSIPGVIYGIMASIFAALAGIYIKKTLPVVENSIFWLTYYKNFNATLLFLPVMISNGEITKVLYFEHLTSPHFWIIMSVAGFFGFIMSQVSTWQIQVTSPLTHQISSTAKNVVQTIMAIAIWQEYKPLLWWVSNIIILIGISCYTYFQQQIMKAEYEKNQRYIQKNDTDVFNISR